MIASQGSAKLASNFAFIVPVQRPRDGITTWEALAICGIAVVVAIVAIVITRWWSE